MCINAACMMEQCYVNGSLVDKKNKVRKPCVCSIEPAPGSQSKTYLILGNIQGVACKEYA